MPEITVDWVELEAMARTMTAGQLVAALRQREKAKTGDVGRLWEGLRAGLREVGIDRKYRSLGSARRTLLTPIAKRYAAIMRECDTPADAVLAGRCMALGASKRWRGHDERQEWLGGVDAILRARSWQQHLELGIEVIQEQERRKRYERGRERLAAAAVSDTPHVREWTPEQREEAIRMARAARDKVDAKLRHAG